MAEEVGKEGREDWLSEKEENKKRNLRSRASWSYRDTGAMVSDDVVVCGCCV